MKNLLVSFASVVSSLQEGVTIGGGDLFGLPVLVFEGEIQSDWEGGTLEQFRDECIELQNDIRFKECKDPGEEPPCANWKLNEYGLNPKLLEAAQQHADDMLEYQYYGHFNHQGLSVKEKMLKHGYDSDKIGENIAHAQTDPAVFIQMFYDSPGHYAPMVYEGYTECAVGYTEERVNPDGGAKRYIVMMFGSGDNPTPFPPSTPDVEESDEDFVLRLINGERELVNCDPIHKDICMTPVAQLHADDMAKNNFQGWKGSDERGVGQRHEDAGCDHFDDENYGSGDPWTFMEGQMADERMKSLIVKCENNVVGIGKGVSVEGQLKWALDFGKIDEIPDQDKIPSTSSTTTAPWPTKSS